ncbi:unnamed protein product, partial [marine sediment metagenome]
EHKSRETPARNIPKSFKNNLKWARFLLKA